MITVKRLLFIFFILIFTIYIFRPIEILGDLKLYKRINGGHNLVYKFKKVGYISGVDSWYVQDNQVYGSISDEDKDDEDYFYINVCTDEKYITEYYLDFQTFLDKKNIDKSRRNYMSGNNIINMNKFKYSKDVSCN